ncbi:hypothetical protein AcW1_002553 [Taiwanofungus camphoratus]|nr:hypothetical protein AcW1_002553 [Antrodia cinnamomea]
MPTIAGFKTFHTFAISTDDPQHKQFGCLCILNEDRVEPNNGFDMHAHRDFEIFTYVVSGLSTLTSLSTIISARAICSSTMRCDLCEMCDSQLATHVKHDEYQRAHFI